MKQILYILSGPVPPNPRGELDRFYFLGQKIGGDIVMPVWGRGKGSLFAKYCHGTYERERFVYHFTYSHFLPHGLREMWETLFYLCFVFYGKIRGKRYDFVVSYGTSRTGLIAWVASILLRSKLLVEVPGNPKVAYLYDNLPKPGNSLSKRLAIRNAISMRISRFVLKRAQAIHLLYPAQIDNLIDSPPPQLEVFHEFVPISTIAPSNSDGKYILLLGFPWYLKGVDTLIEAFKSVSEAFPEHELRIVGYCFKEEQAAFEAFVGDNSRIKLLRPVPYDEAQKLIHECSVLVLPSRTEAMGRVVLEAWAAAKPVVVSNVDGLPFYVKHNHNGLVFEVGNATELANCLSRVLSDSQLARDLANNGRKTAVSDYNEVKYIEAFLRLINTD